jgi:hypothetical protein
MTHQGQLTWPCFFLTWPHSYHVVYREQESLRKPVVGEEVTALVTGARELGNETPHAPRPRPPRPTTHQAVSAATRPPGLRGGTG